MGDIFHIIIIILFIVIIKAQCPSNYHNITLSKCNGSAKSGIFISVDINKIKRPCTCNVVSMFAGDLLVVSRKGASDFCNSKATVYTENKNSTYKCSEDVTDTFPVKKYDKTIINAEYLNGHNSEDFDQCLEISENGDGQGNISVTCGESEITVKSAPSPSNPISKYVMVGATAGGTVIFLGLIFVLMLKRNNDNESMEVNREHTDASKEVDRGHTYVSEEVDRGHTDASEELDRGHTDALEEVDREHTDASEEMDRGHTDVSQEMNRGHTDVSKEVDRGHTGALEEVDRGHKAASLINNIELHVSDNNKDYTQPEEIQLPSAKTQDHLSHPTETYTKHEVNTNHEEPTKYQHKEQDVCSTQLHAVPNNTDKYTMLNKSNFKGAQVPI